MYDDGGALGCKLLCKYANFPWFLPSLGLFYNLEYFKMNILIAFINCIVNLDMGKIKMKSQLTTLAKLLTY